MVDKKEIWAKNMSVRQNYLVKKNFGREKSGMMQGGKLGKKNQVGKKTCSKSFR